MGCGDWLREFKQHHGSTPPVDYCLCPCCILSGFQILGNLFVSQRVSMWCMCSSHLIFGEFFSKFILDIVGWRKFSRLFRICSCVPQGPPRESSASAEICGRSTSATIPSRVSSLWVCGVSLWLFSLGSVVDSLVKSDTTDRAGAASAGTAV